MVHLNEKGNWQLVVLDHGMYRRLTPHFRAAYCRLWKALVTQDMKLGKSATLEMGLDEAAFDALSLMLTYRSANSKTSLGNKMSKDDIDRLKKDYKEVNAGDINKFMQRLPRDLLFVFRNIGMVRALNLDLGGSSRERFRVMGTCA
jgi:aarF domain-containing kinase